MNPQELAELWKRYSPRLTLIVRSIGEPSDDAVQEAFVELSRQPVPPDDPLAWLVRVARNRILQWRRSGQRRARRERSSGAASWFVEQTGAIERRLDAEAVTDALKGLDDEQREVIVMHLWGELSFEEIGEVIGTSRSSAHRMFQTGIRKMKQRFSAQGVPSEATHR